MHTIPRLPRQSRSVWALALATLFMLATPMAAQAQAAYPDKPIKFVHFNLSVQYAPQACSTSAAEVI